MLLELAVVAELAARCAPSVAFSTLAAVAWAESGFQPFAIGVNGPGGGALFPNTREAAVALATDLIVRQKRSVDLGLMQVNNGNLHDLGLTVADVLDPCTNLAAGARILRDGYQAARRIDADPQQALRLAFSRYNTGNSERGVANGYVARVQAAAEQIVPAIRLRGEAEAPSSKSLAPVTSVPLPPSPPAWDVFAQALAARSRQPKLSRHVSTAQPSPEQTADAR